MATFETPPTTSEVLDDLDTPANIERFVSLFYDRLLNDTVLEPMFTQVAQIDLQQHLPTISLYWQKMLLGDERYNNNTMAKHRVINQKHAFQAVHFERWLEHFIATNNAHFKGPFSDRAKTIAANVIKNMQSQMLTDRHGIPINATQKSQHKGSEEPRAIRLQ